MNVIGVANNSQRMKCYRCDHGYGIILRSRHLTFMTITLLAEA